MSKVLSGTEGEKLPNLIQQLKQTIDPTLLIAITGEPAMLCQEDWELY